MVRTICEGTFFDCMHLLDQVFMKSHGRPGVRNWARHTVKSALGQNCSSSPEEAAKTLRPF